MLLVEADEQGIDTICLTDLTDAELNTMYKESLDDYVGSLSPDMQGYGDYQQMCASAVMALSKEAKRRHVWLRALH